MSKHALDESPEEATARMAREILEREVPYCKWPAASQLTMRESIIALIAFFAPLLAAGLIIGMAI